MILLLKLLLAHVLGDFCFQPDRWIADKRHRKFRSPKLYAHIGVHAVLLIVITGFTVDYWAGIIIILLSHLLIDLAKLHVTDSRFNGLAFVLDQLSHVAILTLVAGYYDKFPFSLATGLSPVHWYLITLLAITLFVPAVIIKLLIAQWRPETADPQPDRLPKEGVSLVKAGRFIGILERLSVFVFIITNHWEAVGYLLAAKSIFRFGDLRQGRDRKLTEYVLIGTLLSFGSAILLGLIYVHGLPYIR